MNKLSESLTEQSDLMVRTRGGVRAATGSHAEDQSQSPSPKPNQGSNLEPCQELSQNWSQKSHLGSKEESAAVVRARKQELEVGHGSKSVELGMIKGTRSKAR